MRSGVPTSRTLPTLQQLELKYSKNSKVRKAVTSNIRISTRETLRNSRILRRFSIVVSRMLLITAFRTLLLIESVRLCLPQN
jgi:hypothetical protein